MKRVFADTGGFVALLVAEDELHPRASALFESSSRERWTLVTTNAVVVETYSVAARRPKPMAANCTPATKVRRRSRIRELPEQHVHR